MFFQRYYDTCVVCAVLSGDFYLYGIRFYKEIIFK